MKRSTVNRFWLVVMAVWLGGFAVMQAADTPKGAAPAKEEPPAVEKLPPGANLVRLEAQPAKIDLKNPFVYNQLLITGYLDSGDRIDVTRLAKVEAPADLVLVSPAGLVRPVSNGTGEVKCSIAGQTLSVPITITGQKDKYSASFVRDIMPAMSKLGCNAGTCHGSAQGKNGFKLSLRGYDPLHDYQALTDDVEGRRFNRAAPDRSLMLMKPAGAVPHVGGVLMKPGEPNYDLLRAWIAEGVKLDLSGPRVKSIEIFPKAPLIPLIGMKQQAAVYATYTDGTVRDVSAEAFVESSNLEVATVDKQGLVTAVRRGEATMLARYEGSYAATTAIIMGDRSGFAWKDAPTHNFIDGLVYEKLKQVKILPSDICTDAEFVRRIYLDLTGLPPTPEAVRAFLADKRPSRVKRDEVVDKLIGSADFVEHWTNKWADLLQVNRKFIGEQAATKLRAWIRDAIANNMPYDKFVYSVLTASGSTMENPPAAYHKILREPGPAIENTTQLFLAIRFNCNKCHDHPFERWTQDQYYQTAAYFAQVARKEDPKFKGQQIGDTNLGQVPLVEVIQDGATGDVKHDRTGAITAPKFPYSHADSPPPKLSRREQLARWITSKENPYFAKSYANRIFSYLLGVGIIEPVDDIRAGNPPSNPKLLDRLTSEFVNSGFDIRHLMRIICKSRVYQHSIATNDWNKDDEINYSHALARRLPAEVLYDAVHRATGSVAKLPGMPPGARAAQLLDSNVEIPGGFLDLFGKPPRESACECERSGSMMLGPVLNLINGPVIADAIKDPENRIAKLIATEKDNSKLVRELFLSILCREPTQAELAAGVKSLEFPDDEYAKLVVEYFRRSETLSAYEKQFMAKQPDWEAKVKQSFVPWTVLDPATFVAENKQAPQNKQAPLKKNPDGSIFAGGKGPRGNDIYTVTTTTKMTGITAVQLEVMSDPKLPGKGPGRAPDGNFVLMEFKATVAPENDKSKAKPVKFGRAEADFSQDGLSIAYTIDGNGDTGWAIAPQGGKSHVAVLEFKEPVGFPGGTTFTFKLEQKYAAIGRFRLSATNAKPPVQVRTVPETIVKILETAPDKRTPAQKAELDNHYRSTDAELTRLTQAAADFAKPPLDKRQLGAQDLAWALLNSPAFLFNH